MPIHLYIFLSFCVLHICFIFVLSVYVQIRGLRVTYIRNNYNPLRQLYIFVVSHVTMAKFLQARRQLQDWGVFCLCSLVAKLVFKDFNRVLSGTVHCKTTV